MPIELGSFSLGTVVGGVVVGVFNHYLTKSRNIEDRKIKGFNDAAAKFRSAFVDQIHSLESNIISGEITVDRIITKEVLAIHSKARIEFEPFIEPADFVSFKDAWNKYQNCEDDYCVLAATDPDRPKYHPPKKECKRDESEYFLEHINALLKFAEPKG